MAGPVCQMLLKRQPDATELKELETYLRSIGDVSSSSNPSGWDFWIRAEELIRGADGQKSCQFHLSIGPDIDDYDEEELQQIVDYIGYPPACYVLLYSGCNAAIDHILLAATALAVLDKHEGYIDFTGNLNLAENAPELASYICRNVFNIRYVTDNGTHFYTIADKEFLQIWMNCKSFRMIK